jgi:hypothetical protein
MVELLKYLHEGVHRVAATRPVTCRSMPYIALAVPQVDGVLQCHLFQRQCRETVLLLLGCVK